MRLTSLSLYAATWFTSTTFALVARPSNLQPRAETTLKYPEGYNAPTCRFERSNVILKASPAMAEPPPHPASAPIAARILRAAPPLPPADLAQICRQLSRTSFTGADYAHSYNGHTLDIETPLVRPGLYVITASADNIIRGISIAQYSPEAGSPPAAMDDVVKNKAAKTLGYHFALASPTILHFRITFWWPNTAGEVALFQLGPSGYGGPSLIPPH